MGWSIGYDSNWNRDVGYGVPAHCDHPDCLEEIDRGLAYVCGGESDGGEHGCGLHFCSGHLFVAIGTERVPQLCKRCLDEERPFIPKPDHPNWMRWKLRDSSWHEWREKNPEAVRAIRDALRDIANAQGMADQGEVA